MLLELNETFSKAYAILGLHFPMRVAIGKQCNTGIP